MQGLGENSGIVWHFARRTNKHVRQLSNMYLVENPVLFLRPFCKLSILSESNYDKQGSMHTHYAFAHLVNAFLVDIFIFRRVAR